MSDAFAATATDPSAVITPATVTLESLVGEGKKFKTVEDLARGKAESDAFIARLEQETSELRRELAARTRVEELLANANKGAREDLSQPPSNQPAVLDEAKIAELVRNQLSTQEQQSKAVANRKSAHDALVAHLGDVDKAKQKVAEVTQRYGVDVAKLAETSPEAALQLLGVTKNTQAASSLVTEHGANGHHLQPGDVVRNKAYYDKLRSEMGNGKFLSNQQLQLQMHKDHQRLGADFFK